jgi:hypothetical protein
LWIVQAIDQNSRTWHPFLVVAPTSPKSINKMSQRMNHVSFHARKKVPNMTKAAIQAAAMKASAQFFISSAQK